MSRTLVAVSSTCIFFAALCSSCVFVPEECDYVATQCWDVTDLYCDRWGCWETVHTECQDYCVDSASSTTVLECTQDYHCLENQTCINYLCVTTSSVGTATICEACDRNSDCAETGALCLNLTTDAAVGYCGRACASDTSCPDDYECASIEGVDGQQCVPQSRDCSDVTQQPTCESDSECDDDEICVDTTCTDPECEDDAGCDDGFECRQGRCESIGVACESSEECEGGICIDTVCWDTCETDENCAGELVCLSGLCSPPPEPECVLGTDCGDEGLFHCVDGVCHDDCEIDDDCDFGYYCRAFYCAIDPDIECRTSVECDYNETCIDGECVVDEP